MPPSPAIPTELRVIRGITDPVALPIRTVFLGAVRAATSQIHLPTLAEVLATGGVISLADVRAVAHVDTLVGRLQVDLRPLLERVLFRGSSAGEAVFAENMGFQAIDTALFRRQAQQTARTMVGDLIRGIEHGWIDTATGRHRPGSLETIQNLIAESFAESQTPTQVARSVAAVVGLDDRRAGAMAQFAAKVQARKGLSDKERQRLIREERNRKLKSRGLAIGHTEAYRTASLTQDMIWGQAIEQGQIAEGAYEQEWVASPGAFNPKRCPTGVCARLHGKRAPVGGTFPEPGGIGPPVHTYCYCGKRLRRPE